MKYDSFSADENQRLDEIWLALDKWLQSFLPGEDKDMFGSTEEMNRYVEKWVTDFRKLAARYRDQDGNPIRRKTLGRVPLSVLRLFLSRVMLMPDNEVDAVLSAYNRHPLTAKSGLKLASPLSTSSMSSVDGNGDPVTIGDFLSANAANKGAFSDWKSIEKFLDSMIAAVATRKMEIHNLGDSSVQSRARNRSRARDDDDDYDDELARRIDALRSGIDQLVRMDEAGVPDVGRTWRGGLSESMLSTLAFIAEAAPDVYSIVRRAWSQGHDADTIKQMLQTLSYPTKDVDKIIGKLEAKKSQSAGSATPPSGQPPAPPPSADPTKDKTIYVDRTGKASYDKPTAAAPKPATISTGDDYIDSVLNTALRSGGKEQALKAAMGLLTQYARTARTNPRRYRDTGDGTARGKERERDPFSRATSTILNLDRWLRQHKTGSAKP